MPYKKINYDGKIIAWVAGIPSNLTGWEYTSDPNSPNSPEIEELTKLDWGKFFKVIAPTFTEPMDAIAATSPTLHTQLALLWNRDTTEEKAEDGRKLWNAILSGQVGLSQEKTQEIQSAIADALTPEVLIAAREIITEYKIPWNLEDSGRITPVSQPSQPS